jgi:hypothetical protein
MINNRVQKCAIKTYVFSGFRHPVNQMLRNLGRWPLTDVSVQSIGPISTRQAIQGECLTLEDGADRLSRNVSKELLLQATYSVRRAILSELFH